MKPVFEEIPNFDWQDLHKRFGRLIFVPVTDSDLAEGGCEQEKLVFIDENLKVYVIAKRESEK